jgi:hypothetical protein
MTQHQGTIEWGPCVGPTPLCLGVVSLLCSMSVLIISLISGVGTGTDSDGVRNGDLEIVII